MEEIRKEYEYWASQRQNIETDFNNFKQDLPCFSRATKYVNRKTFEQFYNLIGILKSVQIPSINESSVFKRRTTDARSCNKNTNLNGCTLQISAFFGSSVTYWPIDYTDQSRIKYGSFENDTMILLSHSTSKHTNKMTKTTPYNVKQPILYVIR